MRAVNDDTVTRGAGSADTTRLLDRWCMGDRRAPGELWPIVAGELRRAAGRQFRGQSAGHTLQPTALVNEVFLRLAGQDRAKVRDRSHFLAVAAAAMRQILVNHAKGKRRIKRRGGDLPRVRIDEATLVADDGCGQNGLDLVVLDEALTRLAEFDARKARVVELRFFAGLSIDQTAEALGVSPATVKRDWTLARAWLVREIGRPPGESDRRREREDRHVA